MSAFPDLLLYPHEVEHDCREELRDLADLVRSDVRLLEDLGNQEAAAVAARDLDAVHDAAVLLHTGDPAAARLRLAAAGERLNAAEGKLGSAHPQRKRTLYRRAAGDLYLLERHRLAVEGGGQ